MKKRSKGIIKIAAFAAVILGALFVAQWYQLKYRTRLQETVYAIDSGEVVKNLTRDGEPEELSLNLLRIGENEPVYQRGTNLYVGQGKDRVEEAFPFFANDGNALMIMKDDVVLVNAEFGENTTFQGMYVSDGLSFNYDKSQADEDSFLFLKLNNGLFMNAQPILFEYPGGETQVRMNSIFYFGQDAVRYYAVQKDHSIQYGELPTVKMMTVTIGGVTYSYEQLLMNLGLLGDGEYKKEDVGEEEQAEGTLTPDRTGRTGEEDTREESLSAKQESAEETGAEMDPEEEKTLEREREKERREQEQREKSEQREKERAQREQQKKDRQEKENGSGNNGGSSGGSAGSGSSAGSGGSGENAGNGSGDSGSDEADEPEDSDRPGEEEKPGDENTPGGGDRPEGGDRPNAGDRPGEGDKPNTGGKPGEGDKPGTGDKPGEGNKPSDGTGDITGNDLSGNDLSGNDVSGNMGGNIGWDWGYSHPTAFLEEFTADVYNIASTLEIKDPSGVMRRVVIELYWQSPEEDGTPAPESGIKDDYRLMYRKTFRSAGEIVIDNLPPGTWIYARGIIYYTEENEQKSFVFYDGFEQRVQTLGLECVDDLYLEFEDGMDPDTRMLPNQIMISELAVSGPNPNVIDKISRINILATAVSEGPNKGKTYELQMGISDAKRNYYYQEEKEKRPIWISDVAQRSLPSDTDYTYTIELLDSFGNRFTHVLVGEYRPKDDTVDWAKNRSLNCCEKRDESEYGTPEGSTWTARMTPAVVMVSKKFDDGAKNIERIKYEIQVQDEDKAAAGYEGSYYIQIFREVDGGYEQVSFQTAKSGSRITELPLDAANVQGTRRSYEIWGLTAGHVYEARIYGSYNLRDQMTYNNVLVGSQRFSTVSMASYGRVAYTLNSAHVKTEVWPDGTRKDGQRSPYESATAQKLYVSIKYGYGQTNEELVDLYMDHMDISVDKTGTGGKSVLTATMTREALEKVKIKGKGTGRQSVEFELPAMRELMPDAVSGLEGQYLPKLYLETADFPADDERDAWNLFQNGARLVLYWEDGSLSSITDYQINLATYAFQGGEMHDVTGKSTAVKRLNFTTLKKMPYVTYNDILMASDYIRIFGLKFHDADRAVTDGKVSTALMGIKTDNWVLDYEYQDGKEPVDGYLKEITYNALTMGSNYRVTVSAGAIRRDKQGVYTLRNEILLTNDFQAGDGLEGSLVFESINYPLENNGDGVRHVKSEYSLYNAGGYFVGELGTGGGPDDTGVNSIYWTTSPYIEVKPGGLYYLEGVRPLETDYSHVQFYVDDETRPGQKRIVGINTTTWEADPASKNGRYYIYGNSVIRIPEGVQYMRFCMYGTKDGIPCYATANCYDLSGAKGIKSLKPAETSKGEEGTNRCRLIYDDIKPGTRYAFEQKNQGYTIQFLDGAGRPVGSAQSPGYHGRSIVAPAGAAKLQVTSTVNNSMTSFPDAFEAYELDGEVLKWLNSRDLTQLSNSITLDVKDKKNNLVGGQDNKVYLRIYQGEEGNRELLEGSKDPLSQDVRDALVLNLETDAEGNIATRDLNSLISFFGASNQTFTLELYVMYHGEEVELDTVTFRTDKVLEVIHDRTEMAKTMRYPTGNFMVTADIRLRDNEWVYYGNSNYPFMGHIDFQGHSLTKRITNHNSYIFDVIGSGGVVENLVFNETISCTERKEYITSSRGIATYNYGTIRNIVLNLDLGLGVYRKNYSGGICYQNLGTIENFSVYYTPNSTRYVGERFGGVCYENYGSGVIRNGYVYCPGTLNVTTGVYGGSTTVTNYYSGLLAGVNNGRIDSVYAAGNLAVEEYGANKTNWGNSLISGGSQNVSNSFTVGELQKTVWQPQGTKKVKMIEQYTKCGPVVNGAVNANTGSVQNNYYYTSYLTDYACNIPKRQEKITDAAVFQDTAFYDKTVNRTGQFDLGDLTDGYFPRVRMSAKLMNAQQRVPVVTVTADNSVKFLSSVIDKQFEKGKDGVTEDYALATLIFRNRMGRDINGIEIEGLKVEPREGTGFKQWTEDGLYKVEVKLTPDGTLFRNSYDVKSFTYYGGQFTTAVTGRQVVVTFYKNVTQGNWCSAFNDLKGYYRLAEDIDYQAFSDADKEKAASVLAENNQAFNGCLDGDGHCLKNFEFKRYPYLIWNLSEGVVSDLRVDRMTIDGLRSTNNYCGLIGQCNNNARIEGVTITDAVVTGIRQQYSGTLAGYAGGSRIQDCVVAGTVMQSSVHGTNMEMGALVGRTASSRVQNCLVRKLEMQVKEGNSLVGAGGMVGRIYSGSVVENVYAQGSIESSFANVGGLTGNLYGRVTAGWSKVNINSSAAYVGGIVGFLESGNQATCTLAVGEVYTRATDHYGRIVGGYFGTDVRKYVRSYAAARQKINSEVQEEDAMDAEGLLTNEELRQKIQYEDKINLGDAFDYSVVENGYLPRLYNAAGSALLPCQEGNEITISTEGLPFTAEGIAVISKEEKEPSVWTADYELKLVLTIESEELSTPDRYQQNYERIFGQNYANLSIEDMEFIKDAGGTVKAKNYEALPGGCKLTFDVRALKYLDSYRVVLKTDDGQNGAKLQFTLDGEETPLYRFIYRVRESDAAMKEYPNGSNGVSTVFADANSWQGAMRLAGNNYENFRIMNDLDFTGFTGEDLQRDLRLNRLEGDQHRITIDPDRKQMDVKENYLMSELGSEAAEDRFVEISNLDYTESGTIGTCLIGELSGELKYLRFRNISCSNSANAKSGSNVGILKNVTGKASYLDIMDLNLNYGNATDYVGFIARAENATEYVRGRDIRVNGYQVSGRAVNYVGGIIGYTRGNILHVGIKGTKTEGTADRKTWSYSVNGGARNANSGNYNGGIAGYCYSSMIFCYADTVEITGCQYAGSLAGYANSSSLHSAYSYGTTDTTYTKKKLLEEEVGYLSEALNCEVTAKNYVGGCYGGTNHYFRWSYSENNKITAEGSYAGGIKGNSSVLYNSTVTGCDIHAAVSHAGGISGGSATVDYSEVAYCNIWAGERAGGISGAEGSWGYSQGYVHDCAIYAEKYAGGISGWMGVNSRNVSGFYIKNCYIGRKADQYPHVKKDGTSYSLEWVSDPGGAATSYVGGLAGCSVGSNFYNIIVDDDVLISGWDFGGGFIGEGGGGSSYNLEGGATVDIANAYAGGYAGRLIGYTIESNVPITKVNRSIISGSVKGKEFVGGFAGGYQAGTRKVDPETGDPIPDDETGYADHMTELNYSRILLALDVIDKTDPGSPNIGVITGDSTRKTQDQIKYLRVYDGTDYDDTPLAEASAIAAKRGWSASYGAAFANDTAPWYVTTAEMKNIDFYYDTLARGGLYLMEGLAYRNNKGELINQASYRNFVFTDDIVVNKGMFPYITAGNNSAAVMNYWMYPAALQDGIPIPDNGAVTMFAFRTEDIFERVSIYASGADRVNLEFPAELVMEAEESDTAQNGGVMHAQADGAAKEGEEAAASEDNGADYGMAGPQCFFRIYDGNGKMLQEEMITKTVYTIPYDYQTTLTVKLTAGQDTRSYALTGEGLRHTVMSYGDHCYYLKADGIYRDKGADAGADAERKNADSANTEKAVSGDFVHLYQGKALDKNGQIYDVTDGGNVGSLAVSSLYAGKSGDSADGSGLLLPAESVTPAYETIFDGETIQTYRLFSTADGNEEASGYRLFAKNGKLFGMDPGLDQPYGRKFQSFVADYYSTSQGSAEYLSVLTENMVLKDYKTPVNWPVDENRRSILDNFRIAEVGDNLSASKPYVILRYQDNTAAAFNYLTGSLLFIDDSEKRDTDLLEYADMWIRGRKESLNAANAYRNAADLVGSLVSSPIDDSLIVDYLKDPNLAGGTAGNTDNVLDIATDGNNKKPGDNEEAGENGAGSAADSSGDETGIRTDGKDEGQTSGGAAAGMTGTTADGAVAGGSAAAGSGSGNAAGEAEAGGSEVTGSGSETADGSAAGEAEGEAAVGETESGTAGSGTVGEAGSGMADGSAAGEAESGAEAGIAVGETGIGTAGSRAVGEAGSGTAPGSIAGKTAGKTEVGEGSVAAEEKAGEIPGEDGSMSAVGGNGTAALDGMDAETGDSTETAGTADGAGSGEGADLSLTSDRAYVTMLTAESEGYEVFRASELLGRTGTVVLSENQKLKLLEEKGLLQSSIDLESLKLSSEENRTGLILVGAAAMAMLLLLGILYYKKRKMSEG